MAAGLNTYAYIGGNPLSAFDPLGLEWEAADGSVPGWANRIIVGQRVHSAFTEYVQGLGLEGNTTGPDNVFNGRRPDAFDAANRQIWELKPLSNRSYPLRTRAEAQVASYLAAANRDRDPNDPSTTNCGGWTLGATDALFTQGQRLGYVQIGLGPLRRVYEITLWHDTQGTDTGLVFYRADLIENPTGELIQDILEALANGPKWVILPLPGPGGVPAPVP